jgi:hypothetical protein
MFLDPNICFHHYNQQQFVEWKKLLPNMMPWELWKHVLPIESSTIGKEKKGKEEKKGM